MIRQLPNGGTYNTETKKVTDYLGAEWGYTFENASHTMPNGGISYFDVKDFATEETAKLICFHFSDVLPTGATMKPVQMKGAGYSHPQWFVEVKFGKKSERFNAGLLAMNVINNRSLNWPKQSFELEVKTFINTPVTEGI